MDRGIIVHKAKEINFAFMKLKVKLALSFALVIHLAFVSQMVIAMKNHALVVNRTSYWLFCPQVWLAFFLPPAWPEQDGKIYNLPFMGKILVTFPGSMLCGWFAASAWDLCRKLRRPSGSD